MNVYLAQVSGQGDNYYTLLDKESWDWCNNPTSPIPFSIKDRFRQANGDAEEIQLSKGSAVNDAFLQVPAIKIDGKEAFFTNIKKLINFVTEHKLTILEEWHGYIY